MPVLRSRKVSHISEELQRAAAEVADLGRDNPVGWVYAFLGVHLAQYQADMINSLTTNIRTAVKSCNSIGKDFAAACATLWWVHQWEDAQVVTTAPTWHQVEAIQWKREIHRLYKNSPIPLGGDMFTTEYRLAPGRVAFGISTNNKEKLQGIHSEHLLIIVTEASAPEFDIELWEAMDALMAGGKVSMLMLSNPTRQDGQFYDVFHTQMDQWNLSSVSAFDTPNIQRCMAMGDHAIPDDCPIIIPGLISHEWVEDMRRKWGDDSDFWRIHILGQFPQAGEDTVIPLDWIEQSVVYDRMSR